MVRIGVCVCNRSKDVPKMFESIFTMFFSKNPAFVVQSFVQRTFKDFQLFFKDFFMYVTQRCPSTGPIETMLPELGFHCLQCPRPAV